MTLLDSDDAPIGRILTRREVLALMGLSSAAFAAACAPGGSVVSTSTPTAAASASSGTSAPASGGVAVAVPSCIVRPALSEGPYFVDERLDRSDIRSDPGSGRVSSGVPLAVTFSVARIGAGSCVALASAQVDVWHCDALGVYSDVAGATAGQKFLRGFQRTDANGQAKFTTVYPGWYPGRAVHIHFKIRVTSASGAVSDFTSQLFFDEGVNDAVLAQSPYSQRPASGRVRNSGDGIYRGGGDKLLVTPTPLGGGYAATFEIGLAS